MVCIDVHIGVFRPEVQGYDVLSGSYFGENGVGFSPVVPVGGSTLGHNYYAKAFFVEREGADSAFVLGVDGAVAVGIAQTDGICAAVGSVECHCNGGGGLVQFSESGAVESLDSGRRLV